MFNAVSNYFSELMIKLQIEEKRLKEDLSSKMQEIDIKIQNAKVLPSVIQDRINSWKIK